MGGAWEWWSVGSYCDLLHLGRGESVSRATYKRWLWQPKNLQFLKETFFIYLSETQWSDEFPKLPIKIYHRSSDHLYQNNGTVEFGAPSSAFQIQHPNEPKVFLLIHFFILFVSTNCLFIYIPFGSNLLQKEKKKSSNNNGNSIISCRLVSRFQVSNGTVPLLFFSFFF